MSRPRAQGSPARDFDCLNKAGAGNIRHIVLLGATIFVVLSLDRSRGGVFLISREPIVHIKELLDRGEY